MSTVSQNVLVVTAAVVGSLLFMLGINCVWPSEKRRVYNELIGSQLSILGTTYAVILGFMLYTVWTSLAEADLNADLEADAIVNIYRLADVLPEPQSTQLQNLARSYAHVAVNKDWPEMARNEMPEESETINADMWKTVTSVRPTSLTESTAQNHLLSELSSLNDHRLNRLAQSSTRLPKVLWCVLLIGGALTIMAACTFGHQSVKLQALQIFSLSLLVSLSLVAIADIHRPFHGLIHVRDTAFQRAQQTMQAR